MTYIDANLVIKSMMYIPLNCAIVVDMYKDYRKDSSLPIPQTLTQVYLVISWKLIKGHLLGEDSLLAEQLPRQFKKIADLPQELHLQPFRALAEFAIDQLDVPNYVTVFHNLLITMILVS